MARKRLALEKIQIDFLILADMAEVVNGKLYLMGGGWDRRFVSDFEKPIALNIAVGVLVPWTLANQPHTLTVRLEDGDGHVILPQAEAMLTVGRPPQSTPGQKFRAMISIAGQWKLPSPGSYQVVASLNEETRSEAFYAEKVGAIPTAT